jgi:hypothetical protein
MIANGGDEIGIVLCFWSFGRCIGGVDALEGKRMLY